MEFQTPEPVQQPPAKDQKGLAIASLVLGILALLTSCLWFCGGPFSIVGIVLGVLGLKSSGRGMAIAGIVLSAVGLLILIVLTVVGAVLGSSGDIFNQINRSLQGY